MMMSETTERTEENPAKQATRKDDLAGIGNYSGAAGPIAAL
jgi:hypothetical protein